MTKEMFKKLALIFLGILILQSFPALSEELYLGTTYSRVQSEYFKQDWKKTYISILDMGFEVIRLGAYWNRIEAEKGVYDFESLDWQIKEARKRNVGVILTVGMKAPRWPEYHFPGWIKSEAPVRLGQDVSQNENIRERTLIFVRNVVDHYKNNSAIRYWQVENEPFDRAGPDQCWISPLLVKQEIEIVRKLDTLGRPIVINTATYPNKILRFIAKMTAPINAFDEAMRLCDIIGLNIYPTVGHKMWWLKMYFRTNEVERIKYFSGIVDWAKKNGKEVIVTELQAEPWEPGQVVHAGKDMPLTIMPGNIRYYLNEVYSLGIDTILLWGAEYWHFRKREHKDKIWLKEAVKVL